MSVAEKLQTIAENELKVYNAGQLAAVSSSSALKGNQSGEIIAATDVSPIEHKVGVKVKNKNLFNGVLKDSVFSWGASPIYKRIEIYLTKGTYTISFSTQIMMQSTDITMSAQRFTTQTFTVNEDKEYYMQFRIDVEPNVDWDDSITIQLEEGATATAYTPYFEDLTAVSVKRYGKNLCELGTVTVTQTQNYFDLQYPLKAGITYRISTYIESTDTDNLEYSAVGFYDKIDMVCGNQWINRKGSPAEFTPSRDVTRLFLYPSVSYALSAGDTATFSNIMIVPKGVDTTYEPFIEPTTYTPNEDGTLEIPSLYPSITLTTDTSGVTLTADYIKDIDKAFAEQTLAIAMTGGN